MMHSWRPFVSFALIVSLAQTSCTSQSERNQLADELFPDEMIHFQLAVEEPIFSGTGLDTWDHSIRERGYILMEDGQYKMWYSGHVNDPDHRIYLGYATSPDGIQWTRHSQNPIYSLHWVEDVQVVKYEGTYYMVAEGENDIAHMLTSSDGLNWTRAGDLDIRTTNGKPIEAGPYGTPTLWIEEDRWFLFYERLDSAVWLASSTDRMIWTNVQDDPVIKKGPGKYDLNGVALNQIIKHNDRYYAYYHGTPDPDWTSWNSNVAVSEDLIHWKKYSGNPIVDEDETSDNYSSPILVHDGEKYRLYTMHDQVRVYFPR